jgi:alkanesulfonate monooxygenase SsuD/methylene tetrahydromethanopterin reductase-like flavin-dependent oxidoreductase (luciferase family)
MAMGYFSSFILFKRRRALAATRSLEFGYCPPSGDRGLETVRPGTFVQDLQRVIDIAAPAFSSIWVPDHLMFGSKYRLECWTQMVWIAARYPSVDVGAIVLANSFRHPALVAKMAATLQAFSGGRCILGYGAGWHEEEYRAYGYDYPPASTRIAMLEEGVKVIRALWTEAPANFQGTFYQLAGAYCEPRPDPLPPIMIGGGGEQRTLRVVARHADWWNDVARPPDVLRRKLAVLRDYCQEEGRDYARLRKSSMLRVYIDRSHAAALERAGDALQSDNPPLAGDPAAVREQLHELAEIGIDLCQLIFPRFPDTDDLRLFIDEVLPAFS